MADEEFDSWVMCWEVNMAFQVKVKPGVWKCLCCGRGCSSKNRSYRSEFIIVATECPIQHLRELDISTDGVCDECDQKIVQKVLQREQKCFESGCNRLLTIKEGVLRDRLKDGNKFERYDVKSSLSGEHPSQETKADYLHCREDSYSLLTGTRLLNAMCARRTSLWIWLQTACRQ